MNFFKKTFKRPLLMLFEILDNTSPEFGPVISKAILGCSYFQVLSYLFKIYQKEILTKSFLGVYIVITYTNIENFLGFFLNPIAYQITYIFTLILIYSMCAIHCFLFVFFQYNKKRSENIFFKIMTKWFASYNCLNTLILILPINDILLTIFQKNTPNPLAIDNNNNPLIFLILSLSGICLNFYLGVFSLLFQKKIEFCDKNSLNIEFNAISFISFILRFLLSIFSFFYPEKRFVFFLLIHGFFLLNFLQIYENFMLRNNNNCRFVYGLIFFSELLIIIITFYEYTLILSQRDLAFIIITLGIMGFKFGIKYFDYLYSKNVYRELSSHEKLIYFLEELDDFSHFNAGVFNSENFFFFSGVFMSHLRNCKDKGCLTLKKQFIIKENMKNNEIYATNKLIILKIQKEMKSNSKKYDKFTFLMLSFISFLLTSNVNPVRSFLEIQKLVNLSKNFNLNLSIFNEARIDLLKKKFKRKIRDLSKVRKIKNFQKNIGLSVESFFKINKKQKQFDKSLKFILKEKKKFLECYEIGITRSDQLMKNLLEFSGKIISVEKEITIDKEEIVNNRALHLLKLKFLCIFYSVILNPMNLAFQYADELENLIKREPNLDEDAIKNISFLNPKIALIQISFLKYDGVLRDECKSHKLANFFGYSLFEFISIQSLHDLMPKFLKNRHANIINNFFRKTVKELETGKQNISSYGLHKKGFVFPIKIFHGYSFDYKDDFVMIGALFKPDVESDFSMILCQESGKYIGISENIANLIFEIVGIFDYSLFEYINFLFLIPELQKILEDIKKEKSNTKNSNFNNINGTLKIPKNLDEILIIFQKIQKEYDELNSQVPMNKSLKTFNSTKSMKINNEGTIHQIIPKYYSLFKNSAKIKAEKFVTIDEFKTKLFHEMVSKNSEKIFSINFDFNSKFYSLGSESSNFFTINQIHIRKIKEKKEDIETFELKIMSNSNEDENLLLSNSKGILDVLPEENSFHIKNIFDKVFQAENITEDKNKASPKHLFISDIEKKRDDKESKNSDSNEKRSFQSKSNISSPNLNNLHRNNAASNKTSNIVYKQKNFAIFSQISQIQKKIPSCINKFSISLFFEFISIMIYLIVLSTIYKAYINDKYEPIQKSLISFCSLATSFSYTATMYTEIEYHRLNIIERNLTKPKKNLLFELMNDNYNHLKNINYDENNKDNNLKFQLVYKTIKNFIVDPNELILKTIRFTENIDKYVDLCYSFLNDQENIPNSQLITLQRNYPYILESAFKIYLSIKDEFVSSNESTMNDIFILLMCFMILSCLIKCLEYYFLMEYHQITVKTMRIFRRVSIKDTMVELNFCNDISNILQEPYLNKNFIEKGLNKKDINFDMDRKSLNSSVGSKSQDIKRKNYLKKKNLSNSNIRDIPKTSIYVFMISLIILCFIYYFFNYYFWISNNDSIKNLININEFFIDTYVYCASIIGYNTLGLREKVVRNPEYEGINDSYQNHEFRMKYFYDNIVEKLYFSGNTTGNELTRYTMEALNNLKTDEFNQLVYDNICTLLVKDLIIAADQLDFCEECLNGAFKKGILVLVSQFLLITKNFLPLLKNYEKTQVAEIEKQRNDVLKTLNSQNYQDFIFGYYFFINGMLIYYQKINDFYKGIMDNQMINLNTFLFVTSFFFGISFIGLSYLFQKKMKFHYKKLSLSFSLIPYDRVVNDEQTKFLINSYFKNL